MLISDPLLMCTAANIGFILCMLQSYRWSVVHDDFILLMISIICAILTVFMIPILLVLSCTY